MSIIVTIPVVIVPDAKYGGFGLALGLCTAGEGGRSRGGNEA